MNVHESIKRLTPGKIWKGPEWFGCVNSGNRPTLTTPAIFRGSRKKSIGWIFVGSEMDVAEVLGRSCFGHSKTDIDWMFGDKGGKHPTKRVWKFKGRQGALNKFQKLIDDVLDFNTREREELQAARNGTIEDKVNWMVNQ